MSKETDKAIAKTDSAELPDFLREAEAMGDYKEFSKDEITLPLIMIINEGNPLVKKGHEARIEGLEPGNWFESGRKINLGESIDFIYVDEVKTYGVYSPAPESKFLRALDEREFLQMETALQYDQNKRGLADITGRFLAENEVVGERFRIFGILPGHMDMGLVMMYLKPGSRQALKRWRDLMHEKGVPHHKAVWRMPLVLDKNDKGDTWYNFAKGRDSSVQFLRYVTREEFDICEKIYREFDRASGLAAPAAAVADY